MLIIMGMFMDDASVILLGVLILTPVVKEMGISPIHFSAIITTNAIAGLYTPPMAINYYVGQHAGKSSFAEMFKPAMQIIYFLYVPTALLVTYFPVLSEWLPVMVYGEKILMWAY
jgi:TRAP-type C4-dicarboxylate transport system permease large subunit